ncbi:MAG: replicative DNA helicase [Patescibacteria group bacterium]|nr:replicative DNA helicase [Patescibacteria group bacterium]
MPENLIEKIPPQNIEAEQALLGCLLIDKEAIIKVGDILRPEDFYKESHGLIFQTMLELFEKREPIDILSLANRLEEKKLLETIGGRSYLISLANTVPTSTHVLSYAEIIRKKSTSRRLIQAAAEITELAFKEEDDVEKTLDRAEAKIFSISQRYLKQSFVPIKDALAEAFERIDELHKERGKIRGLPTGFVDLDALLGGLQKSDLIILAARPSLGKSALALDIARQAAVNTKVPVAIFCLEMSQDQVVDRILCAQAGVSLWKMRTGYLSSSDDGDFPKLAQAMSILSEAQIFIDSSPLLNVLEIRTKARRLQAEHGLGLIVVDYLQLMEGVTPKESRVQEVSDISRALKSIARELEIPVLAISQLSRAVEQRGGPAVPKLADLRESGALEQDADVVMFIYRKVMDRGVKCPEEERHLAEIHVAKHRNGPTGVVRLFFDENTVSFKNLASKIEITETETEEEF